MIKVTNFVYYFFKILSKSFKYSSALILDFSYSISFISLHNPKNPSALKSESTMKKLF
jgi:hypothetical protein